MDVWMLQCTYMYGCMDAYDVCMYVWMYMDLKSLNGESDSLRKTFSIECFMSIF